MIKPISVFEVVDCSNEETYFPLGIYISQSEALAVLLSAEPPYNEDGEDSVEIEVRARQVGFHPHQYKTIASRTWVRNWDDEPAGVAWIARPLEVKLEVKP